MNETNGRHEEPIETLTIENDEPSAPAPRRGRAATRSRAKAAPSDPAAAEAAKPTRKRRAKREVPTAQAEAEVEVAVASAIAPAIPHADPNSGDEVAVRLRGSRSVEAQRLVEELREVELEVRNSASSEAVAAGEANPAEFVAGVLRLISENLQRMAGPQIQAVSDMLRGVDLKDYLDPDFWQGVGMVLRYQIDTQLDFIKRRLRGEYELDRFGMDREIIEYVRPLLSFMYRTWFRTRAEGLELLPDHGRAMLIANRAGVLPWDGAMLQTMLAEERPEFDPRVLRVLYQRSYGELPLIGAALPALGQVAAQPEHALQLLEDEELVAVFPEGERGANKLFKDRYRLARFGRGGYVQAAMRSGAPIVPVAVIGSEETYPMLANIEPLARAFNLPAFPITPLFPWLGPLGTLPLPTRWQMIVCPPVPTVRYGADAAEDPLTVFMLSEQIRATIQETLNERLAERGPLF